jgi:micrococcal nuclease
VPIHRHLSRTARLVAVIAVTLVVAACGGIVAPQIAEQQPDARPPAGAARSTAAAATPSVRPTALPRATVAAPPTATPPTATAVPTATPALAPTPEPAPPEPIPTPSQGGGAPTGPVQAAVVTSVTDGDTIRVAVEGGAEQPLRYIGIDTPETVDPRQPVGCYGTEAATANAALVAGRPVVLERDVSETDRYGRLLRYVWLEVASGWLLVNAELIRLGYAAASIYPPDVKYTDLLAAAQQEAIATGAGLWGAACSASPPVADDAGPPTADAPSLAGPGCDPSYPDVCIPPAPPDLDCGDVAARWFTVLPPDPHRFDANSDGVGCESD